MVEPGAFLLFAPCLDAASYTFPASDPETPFAIHGHPWSYTAGAFLGYNYNWRLCCRCGDRYRVEEWAVQQRFVHNGLRNLSRISGRDGLPNRIV